MIDKKLVVLNILNWNCMRVDAQTHKYGMEMVLRPVNDHHLEEVGTTILLAQAKCVSSAALTAHYHVQDSQQWQEVRIFVHEIYVLIFV